MLLLASAAWSRLSRARPVLQRAHTPVSGARLGASCSSTLPARPSACRGGTTGLGKPSSGDGGGIGSAFLVAADVIQCPLCQLDSKVYGICVHDRAVDLVAVAWLNCLPPRDRLFGRLGLATRPDRLRYERRVPSFQRRCTRTRGCIDRPAPTKIRRTTGAASGSRSSVCVRLPSTTRLGCGRKARENSRRGVKLFRPGEATVRTWTAARATRCCFSPSPNATWAPSARSSLGVRRPRTRASPLRLP